MQDCLRNLFGFLNFFISIVEFIRFSNLIYLVNKVSSDKHSTSNLI